MLEMVLRKSLQKSW